MVVITLSSVGLLLYTVAEVSLFWELEPLIGKDLRLQGVEAQILSMMRGQLELLLLPEPMYSYCYVVLYISC